MADIKNRQAGARATRVPLGTIIADNRRVTHQVFRLRVTHPPPPSKKKNKACVKTKSKSWAQMILINK